ncbi:hypothetical protein AALP_AAs70435U000200 [Arabis alpina]|uniref:Uncharacterized protein n=1 Tax=Arabis alpina TaxID=50452 RepID=A0A087FZC5_ARAAL|nr:hypothetical protein AALP_AAs70435U000200 [Arabis alpina]
MKKKRGTGKGRNAAATSARCTDADLRRLAEAAAAEKTNSGQRNSGDPANGGSYSSIARPKARVGTQHPVLEDLVLIILPSTSIPTQYSPSTQRPQLLWRQPLSSRLNPRQSQKSQQSLREEEQHASDGLNPHHGDYEVNHHQNQVELPHEEVYQESEESDGEEEEGDEQVEEHVVDPAEQQEYDQLLNNLNGSTSPRTSISPQSASNTQQGHNMCTLKDKFGLGQLRSKRGKRKRDEGCGSSSSSFLDMQQQLQVAQQKLADQDLVNARRDARLDKLLTILKQKDPAVAALMEED